MPTDPAHRRPVTIWLTPAEKAALDQHATAEQRPRSVMARILLTEALTHRTRDETTRPAWMDAEHPLPPSE